MSEEELVQPEIRTQEEPSPDTSKREDAPAPPSRMDRLKRKLKKLQGKDPDIYPMW